MKTTENTNESMLPTFESMPQVRATTGMPITVIKAAKKSGCTAFVTGNRIKLGPLLRWFFSEFDDAAERPPDGLATWREALNRAQTKREELRLATESRELIPVADSEAAVGQAIGVLFAGLEMALGELPPMLEGRSLPEINSRCQTIIELLKTELRRAFAQTSGENFDEGAAVQAGEQIIRREVFAAVNRIAFADRVAHEYGTFKQWLAEEKQLRSEQRGRWLKYRAAAGLPVPNASEAELREHPTLKRQ
jgi:hypothetical protein